jgi:hypothetical protein
MANSATMGARGRATAELPHQKNDTNNNLTPDDEKKEEVHINLQPEAPENVINRGDSATTSHISEEESTPSSRGGTRRGNPELRMSDWERKKREEMDQSSDPLIVSLTAEQSKKEEINLMKYLREFQKQDIVIEV